ncbi:hypothetical protein DSL72_007356 [Monilinia vaccinii-corymbosi]|uniref:C4-dicarboxylate transporter/malic acid transport protein n=1 Tax=Monilinia vaccinii-corymbosi TaxID=61207 RepID=A0A8A3PM81_9HELO|nr:hypothetical protein DSL72_007356 [Monilinia vaccinii-corymbosi]
MSTQCPNRRNDTTRSYSTNALEAQNDHGLRDSTDIVDSSNEKPAVAKKGRISFRMRIHHFTWVWFTLTMSTGGIALLLASTPHRFTGLTVLGDIVFIFDLLLFVLLCTGISARFILYPKSLASSLQDSTESLFFPTFWISLLSILSNVHAYGAPHCGTWLITTLRVLFWIYATLTFFVAVVQYCYLFAAKQQTLQSMSLAWILPIFPIMLSGTLASVLAGSQPPNHALPIVIAGVTFQGLGMLVAVSMYGPYIGRLMTSGLPEPNTRPGMFIAVGPPSFTGLALMGMSEEFARIYPAHATIAGITNPDVIADVFRVLAVSTAVFLWAMAFWFVCISMVSVLGGVRQMSFHLLWYAFVFPNVGFAIVIIKLGQAFQSEGLLWVGSALTVILVGVWLGVLVMHVRAVILKQLLWPEKDEDEHEGERARDG